MIDSGLEYRVRPFANDGLGEGQILPTGINYLEHDIYPVANPAARGMERIITGSDGSAWYTFDHYDSFMQIR